MEQGKSKSPNFVFIFNTMPKSSSSIPSESSSKGSTVQPKVTKRRNITRR